MSKKIEAKVYDAATTTWVIAKDVALTEHEAVQASATNAGHVQLTSSIESVSEVLVPTAKALSTVYSSVSSHVNDTANPHSVTKAQVGLGNVDNTADINKPISQAAKEAIDEINAILEEFQNNVNAHIASSDSFQKYKLTLDDGTATRLADNYDLTTIVESGVFRVGITSSLEILAGTYLLIAIRNNRSTGALTQILINENTSPGTILTRTKTVAGVWSAWDTVVKNKMGEIHPETAVTAPVGTLYTDKLTGNLYYKQTGNGDIGWKQIALT